MCARGCLGGQHKGCRAGHIGWLRLMRLVGPLIAAAQLRCTHASNPAARAEASLPGCLAAQKDWLRLRRPAGPLPAAAQLRCARAAATALAAAARPAGARSQSSSAPGLNAVGAATAATCGGVNGGGGTGVSAASASATIASAPLCTEAVRIFFATCAGCKARASCPLTSGISFAKEVQLSRRC